METLCMWRWYIPDLKGRLKPSRWPMTEDQAKACYPGCAKVESSLEVRENVRGTSHTMASGLVLDENGALVPAARKP